jgi:hypothetical protein
VIVVGLAISVGFVIFNSGAYNSNKTAIATDMQEMSTKMMQYWLLPTSMGGANKTTSNVSIASIGSSLGFTEEGGIFRFVNDNGEFRVLSADNGIVVIGAIGTATKGNKYPYAEMSADLMTQSIETELSESTGF